MSLKPKREKGSEGGKPACKGRSHNGTASKPGPCGTADSIKSFGWTEGGWEAGERCLDCVAVLLNSRKGSLVEWGPECVEDKRLDQQVGITGVWRQAVSPSANARL